MRILITGATSAVGRTAAARLLAAGHRVSGVSQQSHPCLDGRVELTRAALNAPVLHDLADAADVVIHLAPIEDGVPEGAGINGLVHTCEAAARAGARLVFLSQAAGAPALYRQAEELVESCWAPSLIVRIAPPVGRQPDWMVSRTVASLLTADTGQSLRVLHTDDLHRFLVRAACSHRTGVVDVGTADAIPASSARRWLGTVDRRRRLTTWSRPDPDLNFAALHHDWEFSCGWTAAQALADTGRALQGRRLGADGAVELSARLPVPGEAIPRSLTDNDGAVLHRASDSAVGGEFDDPIDSRFAHFSARNTSDALPGPLTPMTLDVHGAGLRAAHRATAEIMALPKSLAEEWQARGVAVFAHRIFTGESIGQACSAAIPFAASTVRVLSLSRRYSELCSEYATPTPARPLSVSGWAQLSDAQLDVRIPLLRDYIHQGWVLSTVGVLLEALLLRAGRPQVQMLPLLAATTSTGHLASETAALAGVFRSDDRLRALAAIGDLAGIRTLSPAAAAIIDASVARVGYRGPGEAELANPVIAGSPGQLLAAAAMSADPAPAPVPTGVKPTLPQRLADTARTARETAWDATARQIHQLRLALREKGNRMTGRRLLACADDIFYLTLDEALTPPVDTRLRVIRRRAERERLQDLNMPDVIDGRWAPLPDAGAAELVALRTRPEMEPQGQA